MQLLGDKRLPDRPKLFGCSAPVHRDRLWYVVRSSINRICCLDRPLPLFSVIDQFDRQLTEVGLGLPAVLVTDDVEASLGSAGGDVDQIGGA